jgi:hypothetical protein
MKTTFTHFTLAFIATLALSSAFANLPENITCDSQDFFHLRKLTRIEFTKTDTTTYKLTLFKEESCGPGTGCMHLAEKFTKNVYLFESPMGDHLIVTPGLDFGRYDDSITINLQTHRCKVKLSNGTRFRGRVIDIN